MNHSRFWAAAAAIVLLGACTAEKQPQIQEVVPQEPQVETREVVITAYSTDGSSTKSSRGENGVFLWSPGDAISVFYGSGNNGGDRFTSDITEPTEIVDFQGTVAGTAQGVENPKYWGVYPYNTINSCDGQKLVTEIPSRQVAAANTFADGQFISIGRSETEKMGFYHLCGGIKFKLSTANVTRITLKGNNSEVLAGIVEVTIDGQNHPIVSNVITPQYEIVLTPPANSQSFTPGVEYYFVTKPVAFQNGFTVTIETDNTIGKRVVNSSMTVHRAKFQWSNSTIDSGASFIQLDKPDPNIVPSAVQSYIQKANEIYPEDTDYKQSVVGSYTGSDKPEPVTITWTNNGATLVRVSTSSSFTEGEVLSQNNILLASKSAKIYNLIPGIVYYYRVYAGDSIIKEGCFRPVGPLRMVFGVTDNVRDLGGWQGEDGKTIRYGKLYRGANIDNIMDNDHTTNKDIFLNTLNMGLLMDLRGYVGSSTEGPSNPFDGSDTQMDYSIYRVWKYLGFGTTDGHEAELQYEYLYRDAIKCIISYLGSHEKGIYFHCSAGSDRTGTLAFLIEALLGVSECDMSIDYELTSYSYYKGNRQNRKRNATGSYPYKTFVSYLKNTYNKGTMQKNVEAWAKDGDSPLTDADIAQLKALLLE